MKNTMTLKIVIILLIIVFVSACKPMAVDVDNAYIGNWRTDNNIHDGFTTLKIQSNGKAHYLESGPTAEIDVNKTARIEDDIFYIGNNFFVTIDQAPTAKHDTSCTWNTMSEETCIEYEAVMILGGSTFYKVIQVY